MRLLAREEFGHILQTGAAVEANWRRIGDRDAGLPAIEFPMKWRGVAVDQDLPVHHRHRPHGLVHHRHGVQIGLAVKPRQDVVIGGSRMNRGRGAQELPGCHARPPRAQGLGKHRDLTRGQHSPHLQRRLPFRLRHWPPQKVALARENTKIPHHGQFLGPLDAFCDHVPTECSHHA
nr:putative toluene monooxygenase subunit C [uncultured bacterium]